MLFLYLILQVVLVGNAGASSPLVKLDYTTYRGLQLANGVTQWLGMRYAAPPLGSLRFSAPSDPVANHTTQLATQHGPLCLATGADPDDTTSSEDCLYLDVYAPSNATNTSNLPVFFFIQGGGFNSNSNPNLNGSGLIEASGNKIVVMNLNYRVGPWGFLASNETLHNGSINTGLKDQLKALQWTQKYISMFGGDPQHVTIGGDSAGAASVSLLLSAYGGQDMGLFHAAAAESCSFATVYTIAQSQFTYNNLVIRTGCASATNTLSCLRNLTTKEIQLQNFNTPFPGAQNPPLYLYGPTLDNDLIRDYTYSAFANGKFVHVPTIFGDDTNGGTVFAPKSTANISQSDTFLHDQFPALTLSQLAQINDLYPVAGTPSFPDSGRYWRQVSKAYGDIRYTCPGIFISSMYESFGVSSTWNYLYNVIDPPSAASGYGVTHTIEVNAIWGPYNVQGSPPASYYPNGTNANIVPVIQGYWTSFIRAFDPNMYRYPGSPMWAQWTQAGQKRLVFQTNDTMVEATSKTQRDRCSYLASIGPSINQ